MDGWSSKTIKVDIENDSCQRLEVVEDAVSQIL
jgi:hypothetical protein